MTRVLTAVSMATSPTVAPERSSQVTRQLYPNFKVIVLNDDFNTFQHVAECLVTYIPGMTGDRAWELTKIHYEGQAIVWIGPQASRTLPSATKTCGFNNGSFRGGLKVMKPARGRLVLNHSTHIPGLIRVLERLTSWMVFKQLHLE